MLHNHRIWFNSCCKLLTPVMFSGLKIIQLLILGPTEQDWAGWDFVFSWQNRPYVQNTDLTNPNYFMGTNWCYWAFIDIATPSWAGCRKGQLFPTVSSRDFFHEATAMSPSPGFAGSLEGRFEFGTHRRAHPLQGFSGKPVFGALSCVLQIQS